MWILSQVLRADISSSWHLALPLHLAVGHLTLHSPTSSSADIFRFLLKLYPGAAMIPDGRGNTPYGLAIRHKGKNEEEKHFVHSYFVRLLLRSCPTLNETEKKELHRLNYEERRMAMFLGLCGKTNHLSALPTSKSLEECSSVTTTTTNNNNNNNQRPFSLWSQRRFSDDLFRHIVMFL